jgi:hypothetical protein
MWYSTGHNYTSLSQANQHAPKTPDGIRLTTGGGPGGVENGPWLAFATGYAEDN